MKNLTKRVKIIMIVLLAAFFALCAAVGGYFIVRENRLNELQKEALEELEANRGEYAEQTIVLRNTSFGEANALAKKYGATLRITSDGKFATLKLPAGVTIEDIYAERANRGDLPKLSADYYTRTSELEIPEDETPEHLPTTPSTTPSDPDFTLQSYINYLHLGETWNGAHGNGVTVAVIDTGIDTNHPEFKGKISEYSYNATTDEVLKDTAPDGSDDYDWSLIEDEQGHGTAVAGTIAAAWNEDGIAGIAPDVTLLVIKAECSANGVFVSTSDLVFGLYYAVERDADIVNMSFGIVDNNPFESATRLAVDSDVICVAAAGNESTAALTYPAADENVIGVGALAENSWELADYSNYGENVDMVAPGTVYTTKMGGGYGTIEGTSFASPITAGALALYLSGAYYPTFESVKEVLFASCYDLGGLGKDFTYGYGALDVNALVVEEKGTVTFDMLTDELENTEQIFIRNHTLQDLPEPERNYAVFDGWYYDIHCTEELNWYEDAFSKDLTLYANWVNEDDGVPYTYVRVDDGIEIQSYTGKRRYITIPDEIEETPVVSIGDFAFANETRLRLVNLPATLKRIGQGAFQNCNNLLEITVPDSVTTIGSYSFQNNIRLASVYFSGKSTLTSIGSEAFANCSSLTRFSVPTATVSLDGSAFMGTTSMRAFSVEQGNTAFSAKDGVLFTRSMSTLVAYPAGLTAETYTIPDSVRELGAYSFAFAKNSNVELEGIAWIGECAFAFSRLEQVTIPDSVTAMGEGAFFDCTYLCNVTLGHGLNLIPASAFARCSMLESIQIPQEVTIIDGSAFAASGLGAIEFEPGSDLVIIGGSAFAQTPLTSIHLPASLMVVGDDAFKATLLSEVVFDGSDLQTIGDEAFRDTASLQTIILPENLRSLGAYSFMNSGLREVALPASLTELGEGTFAECHDLANINVAQGNPNFISKDGVVYDHTMSEIVAYPAGNARTEYAIEKLVKTIGPAAFYGAWNLQSVTLPQELVTVGEYGFYDCAGMTSYTLPQTLESIEEYAFSQNTSLSMIEIPDSVTKISRFAFAEDYALIEVVFGPESELPRIGYAAFAYTGINSFRVPKNVSTIGQEAFAGSKDLTSLTFAEGSRLDIIPAYFLKGSEQIQSITFENGSALTSIAAHGFEGMRNLYSIDFGNAKLANIDNFAFRYDASLSSITLPETVTDIGRYAFYGCNALTRLEIPASIEHIGTYAFYGAENLDIYFKAETLPLYLQENWDEGIRGYYVGVNEVTSDGTWRYATLKDGTVSVIEYLGTETTLDLNAFPYGKVSSIGGNAFAYSDVESVTLPESLTSIQAYAFAYSKLKQIIIPASVEFIGKNAFYNTPITNVEFANASMLKVVEQYAFALTKSLTSVTVPASVVTMGTGVFSESGIQSVIFPEDSAFSELPAEAFYSTKLVSVDLPDSIVYIGDNAFRNTETLQKVTFGKGKDLEIRANAFYNTGLTELTIPANVEYIGEYAFVGLQNLEKFVVDGENPYYSTDDKGVLYNKDKSKLIAVPAGMGGTFIVPATVETIGFGAFENSALTAIDFSNVTNLLTFGYRAFYNMQSLTEFTVPASVVSIDYYAFALCSALERVNFADGNRLAGIYEGAFYGCTSLKDIELPDSIVEISDYAFYGCSSLTKIPVSETSKLKGIYDYAFAYTGITELVIPESVIDIGAYAFRGAKLKSLTIPDENKLQLIIGIGAFADCNDLTEVTLPFIGASFEDDEITWLGYIFGAGSYEANATYTPASLKIVTLTEGLTKIGYMAFYGLADLQTVNVPHTVTMVGYGSFLECPARYELTNVISFNWSDYLDHWASILLSEYIGKGIYGSLRLAEGVTNIYGGAFADCVDLTVIEIPQSVTIISSSAFFNSGLISIAIPECVTTIEDGAFYNCRNLINVNISSNITSIETGTFGYCSSLQKIEIPQSVTSIGDRAFTYCSSLREIDLPQGITSIENYAFSYSGLSGIVIPSGVKKIGEGTFTGCSGLMSVVIPAGVTNIGDYAFDFCTQLYKVVNHSDLPIELGDNRYGGIAEHALILIDGQGTHYKDVSSSVEYIETTDDFLFQKENGSIKLISYLGAKDTVTLPKAINEASYTVYRMTGVKNVIIPKTFTQIDDEAFYASGGLTTVTVEAESELKFIGNNAFYECRGLVSVTLPASVTSIGDNAFYYCSNLESFDIPESVISIGNYAFFSCSRLESIDIPESVETIGNYAFDACNGLERINISEGVTSIGSGAFYLCESLESIDIPESVTSIGDNAFYRCISLKSVDIPVGITVLSESIFSNCTNLIRVGLPESITRIDYYAFDGCRSLKDIDLPTSVNDILGYAFRDCSSLTRITLPTKITTIAQETFCGCSSLQEVIIPDNVQSIGSRAFQDCVSLAKINIPVGVSYISGGAFQNCNIKEFTIDEANKNFINIDGIIYDANKTYIVYVSGTVTDITIPASITSISGAFSGKQSLQHVAFEEGSQLAYIDSAFSGCSNLTSIEIPDGVTYIGASSFEDCKSLTSIEIPASVEIISSYAFKGCTSLTRVTFEAESCLTTIGYGAFYDCENLVAFEVPMGVTSIEWYAFMNCYSLTSIHLPAGLTTVENCFLGCPLDTITIDPNNETLEARNGVIYDKAMTKIIYAIPTLTEIEIPASVTDVSYLLNCNKISSLSFAPDSVLTEIPGYTFREMAFLSYVKLPDNLISISSDAFRDCVSLASIEIPAGVTRIGSEAFELCDNLYLVINHSDLPIQLGSSEYGSVARNAKVLIDRQGKHYADGVTGFEYVDTEDGFRFMKENEEVKLIAYFGEKDTITLPRDFDGAPYTVYRMFGVKNVIIPDSFTQIDDFAFSANDYRDFNNSFECNTLTSIEIPESVTTIGGFAFYGCEKLTSVRIPASVQNIEGTAFAECTNLVTVIFEKESKLTIIGARAFQNCYSLTNIKLPDGVIEVGSLAFDGTAVLTNPQYWNEGILQLGNCLVKVDENATDIVVDLDIIAEGAFDGCYRLRRITIGGDRLHLLAPLTNLETLIITEFPSHWIGEYFGWDSSIPITLKNIILKKGVDIQGSYAFYSVTGVNIYVEAEKDSVMWDHDYPNWANGNKVYYGGEWISAEFYGLDGELIDYGYYTTSQIIRQPYVSPVLTDDSVSQFVGWDLDNDGEADFVPATSITNIVARAVLVKSERLYHVNFADENGHVYESHELRFNEAIPEPATPEKRGYTFIEWNGYTSDMVATKDVTFYAVWSHNGEHNYQCVHHNATCTEWGYDEYTCSVCGESYREISKDEEPTGHSFEEWVVTQTASCETAGSHSRDCKNCQEREVEEIAPTGHSFTREVKREATCEEEGEVTFSCENCDLEITEPLSKTAHHYEKKYVSKTFLQWLIDFLLDAFFGYDNGKPFYYQCTECGQIQTRAEANRVGVMAQGAHIHTLGEWKQELAPTCSEYGVLGARCTVCDELVAAKQIDMVEHQYSDQYEVDEAPTCTENGKQSHHCIWCDQSDGNYETISATGHHYGTPTWTWNGYTSATATFTCDQCDEGTDGHIMSVKADIKAGSRVDATCVNEGSQEYTATVTVDFGEGTYTAKTTQTLDIDSTAHTNLRKVERKAATCTQDGYEEYYYCDDCGHMYSDADGETLIETPEVIPATGHSYGDPTWKWEGYISATATFTCDQCDEDTDGHTMSVKADIKAGSRVDATCVNEGSQEYIATVTVEFGEGTYTAKTTQTLDIDSTAHTNLRRVERKEATCTQDGYEEYYYCDDCGHMYSDAQGKTLIKTPIVIPAGHNFDEGHVQAKDPTCTESGNFEYYHCATCDKYFKNAQGANEYGDQEWIRAATGHQYSDDWKQTKAPTYTEKGTEERSCTVCGEKETRDVPALGLAQKFKDEVALIDSATTSEQKFDAIKRAAETWNGLSEEERAQANDAYNALKSVMESYNTAVEAVNDAYDSAFKTAISVMSTALAAASALAAVWFVRRKFH